MSSAHMLPIYRQQDGVDTVKENEIVALVGKSGCGKSSLIALINRFYDPQEGEILFSGFNIKAL